MLDPQTNVKEKIAWQFLNDILHNALRNSSDISPFSSMYLQKKTWRHITSDVIHTKACPVVLVKFEAPRTGTLWSIFGVYAFTVTSPVINLTRRWKGMNEWTNALSLFPPRYEDYIGDTKINTSENTHYTQYIHSTHINGGNAIPYITVGPKMCCTCT